MIFQRISIHIPWFDNQASMKKIPFSMNFRALQYIVYSGIIFAFTLPSEARWVATNWTTGGFVQSLTMNGTVLFAGTDGTGVFMTRNDGDSWSPVNSGLTKKYVPSLSAGGKNIFAGTTNGVFLSTNTGVTWTAMNPTFMNKYIQSLALSGSNLFAGTTNGLYLTTNNGASWTSASLGLTDTTVYSVIIDGKELYAGTNNGVYRSTNNGADWTPVNTGMKNMIVYSLAANSGVLFAGTYYNGVFVSADNGATWTPASTGIKSNYINSLAITGVKLFAGTYNGVYVSVNHGRTWSPFNAGLTDTLILSLAISDSYLFAGTSKDGVWRLSLSEVSVNGTPNPPAEPAAAFTVPDRMHLSSSINWKLEQPDRVVMTIHDMSGRTIMTLLDKRLDAGMHCLPWEGKNLSAGFYSVKMQTSAGVLARGFSLIP